MILSMFATERIVTPGLAQNSYIVYSAGEALVIDPRRDIQVYRDFLAAHRLRLIGVAETHAHADFVSGAPALAASEGVRLYSSTSHAPQAAEGLAPGAVIPLGDAEVVALFTPGHTPNHFAFYVSDRHDRAQTPALFSGDLMFVGDLGRPELLGDRKAAELAPALYHSIWETIAALPPETTVYPGHGAGSLCGKNLSSEPTSTLAKEFATSPALQLKDLDAFVAYMTSDQPRVPPSFLSMIALNTQGASAPEAFTAISELDAEAVRAALADPAVLVIDGRGPEAFAAGHLRGAVSLGVNPGMPTWMGWLVKPEQRIVALVESAEQAQDLRTWMTRVGFDQLDGYHRFDPLAWPPADLRTLDTIPAQAFDLARAPAQFIDLRTPAEVARGTYPTAHSIPLCELPARMREIDPEAPVLLFCGSGYRSAIAGSLLLNAGYARVTHVAGGYAAMGGPSISCAASEPVAQAG